MALALLCGGWAGSLRNQTAGPATHHLSEPHAGCRTLVKSHRRVGGAGRRQQLLGRLPPGLRGAAQAGIKRVDARAITQSMKNAATLDRDSVKANRPAWNTR